MYIQIGRFFLFFLLFIYFIFMFPISEFSFGFHDNHKKLPQNNKSTHMLYRTEADV